MSLTNANVYGEPGGDGESLPYIRKTGDTATGLIIFDGGLQTNIGAAVFNGTSEFNDVVTLTNLANLYVNSVSDFSNTMYITGGQLFCSVAATFSDVLNISGASASLNMNNRPINNVGTINGNPLFTGGINCTGSIVLNTATFDCLSINPSQTGVQLIEALRTNGVTLPAIDFYTPTTAGVRTYSSRIDSTGVHTVSTFDTLNQTGAVLNIGNATNRTAAINIGTGTVSKSITIGGFAVGAPTSLRGGAITIDSNFAGNITIGGSISTGNISIAPTTTTGNITIGTNAGRSTGAITIGNIGSIAPISITGAVTLQGVSGINTSGSVNVSISNTAGTGTIALNNDVVLNQKTDFLTTTNKLGYTIQKTFGPANISDVVGTYSNIGSQALPAISGVYIITCGFTLSSSSSSETLNEAYVLLSTTSGTSNVEVNAFGAWRYLQEVNEAIGSAGLRYQGTLCGTYINNTGAAATLYLNAYGNTSGAGTISCQGNCSITKVG